MCICHKVQNHHIANKLCPLSSKVGTHTQIMIFVTNITTFSQMEKHREMQKELHTRLIDLEKAYDRVPQKGAWSCVCWRCLREQGVTEKYDRSLRERHTKKKEEEEKEEQQKKKKMMKKEKTKNDDEEEEADEEEEEKKTKE